jgi:glutamate 5-kinase
MDRLDSAQIITIARTEVEKYAGGSHEATAYPISDDQRHTYAVNAMMHELGPDRAWIIVQARVVGDFIVIDEDNVANKPLIQALLKVGVPREQIICAYTGEHLPTADTVEQMP